MKIKGIDVSKYQGKINWSQVKSDLNCDFAILRAGFGRAESQVDERFAENYNGCKNNGIPVGAYWYSYATTVEQAIEEAQLCIKTLGGREFQYPIYFDVEEQKVLCKGKTAVSAIIKAFCLEIEKAGYWAGVYMSASPASSLISDEIKDRFAFWIADYRKRESAGYNGQHGMWQYSSKGSIKGIVGNVDVNYCYVDYPALIASKKVDNQPKVEPVVQPVQPVVQPTVVKTSNTIVEGDKGEEVRKMQNKLVSLGFLRANEVDGDFGKITLGALLAFQFKNNLDVDGKCGPKTKAALGI